jgi:uncharacterized membrane protein YdbT with pleckstrin-like domain
MQYKEVWDKTLNPSEEVKFEFSIGKGYRMLSLIGVSAFGFLLLFTPIRTVGVILILFAFFYFGYYLKVANAYAFTNRRVLIHRGWLGTKLISTEYQKITDVTVHEPFIDRIFTKTGSIEIDTAGTGKEEIILKNIERPYEVKKKLDELRGHR